MARTDLDICNQALAMLGAEGIDAIDDETPNGERCLRLYRPMVRDFLLSQHRWVFAARLAQLDQLYEVPNPPLPYVYASPSDIIGGIHAFRASPDVRDRTLHNVRQFGTNICLDETPVWAEYTAAVPESAWPSTFQQCAVHLLAAQLAWSLQQQRRGTELRAQALGSQFDDGVTGGLLLKAMTEDGKGAPEREAFACYDDGALVGARVGGNRWGALFGPFTNFQIIPPPED